MLENINPFAVSGLLTFITTAFLGFFSLSRGKKFIHKLWTIFDFSVAIWGLGAFKFSTALEREGAFLWLRIGHLGVIFIPVFFLHFVYTFLEIKEKRIVWFSYTIAGVFCIINITDWLGITNLFIVNLRYVFNSFYVDSPPGVLYPFFVVFFFILAGLSLYKCAVRINRVDAIKKLQIKYFFIGMTIGFGGGGTAFLMVFNIDVYPWPHFGIFLYPIIIGYAIFRYQLLDIKVALTRAGVFLFTYALILGLPFLLYYYTRQGLLSTGLAVTFASAGPFIYSRLREKVEQALFKKQSQYQYVLQELSERITEISKDENTLLKTIAETIYQKLKLSFVVTCRYCAAGKRYEKDPQRCLGQNNLPENILENEMFIRIIKDSFAPQIIDQQDIPALTENALIVPYIIRNQLLGFFILGVRQDKEKYTQQDVDIFKLFSSQISLALENCKFWEAESDNERKSRLSDIEAFSSTIEHETRKLIDIVSMKINDLIFIFEDSWKNILPREEAESLEHKLNVCEENLKAFNDASKNIRDYSKGTAGVVELLKVDEVVRMALTIVKGKLLLEGVEFVEEVDDNLCVKAEKARLAQVLVNLMSNSVDALKNNPAGERKLILKIYQKDLETLRLEVKDNGSGIARDDLEHIFEKFFTTKKTTGGTGIGLAEAVKIVESYGGKLWAQSQGRGKGATFIIELPWLIKKEAETIG